MNCIVFEIKDSCEGPVSKMKTEFSTIRHKDHIP